MVWGRHLKKTWLAFAKTKVKHWLSLRLDIQMPRCGWNCSFFSMAQVGSFLGQRKLWEISWLGWSRPLFLMIKVCGLAWCHCHTENSPTLALTTPRMLLAWTTCGVIFCWCLSTLIDFWCPPTGITSSGVIFCSLISSLFPYQRLLRRVGSVFLPPLRQNRRMGNLKKWELRRGEKMKKKKEKWW